MSDNNRAKNLAQSMIANAGMCVSANQAFQSIDLGAEIENALGVQVPDNMGEVLLFTLIVDDSSSINYGNNTQIVKDGVNLILDALRKSKQRDTIQIQIQSLNSGNLLPFTYLSDVQPFGPGYNPSGMTPLYESTVDALGVILLKREENDLNGIVTRTVTYVITDGGDNGGPRHLQNVIALIAQLRQNPEVHIIGAMGIDDNCTDFKAVFNEMGIDPRWVLTPANTPEEIRKAFEVASSSAQQASQAAGSFSQASLGGFGS